VQTLHPVLEQSNTTRKIIELAAIGGGNISKACFTSFEHTVLVNCQIQSVNIVAIQNFLSVNGWEKMNDTEFKIVRYKKSNDVLTIEQGKGFYFIGLILNCIRNGNNYYPHSMGIIF
jgi:hypothetical protein